MSSALPGRRSPLVGRHDDLAAVVAALEDRQLVTLLGVGGVGKSALAVEAARQLEGEVAVHLVDLTGTRDGTAVASAVADQLGLGSAPDVAPVDAVTAALADGPHLLVLDSCEHVVDAVADLVDVALGRCPELRVLATSRTRLEVDGERVLPVAPLALGAEPGRPSPAVELLVERATTAGAVLTADDPLVAELAQRLDGVPLALELAGARLGQLPLSSLLDQLEDRLPELTRRRGVERHQSLSAVLAWSVDLLDASTQEALRALSVFEAGFALEGARSVAGEGADEAVASLVAASLLEWDDTHDGPRYRMLAMIRSFGREQLRAAGELDEVARRHAVHLAAWGTAAQQQLRGPAEPEWVPRFAAGLPDLGAALRWASRAGALELVGDLACALGDHVYARTGREVHAWVDEAVAALDDPYASEDLTMLAVVSAQRRGDLAAMERLLDVAVERGHRGLRSIQSTEAGRGVLALFQGRPTEAEVHLARAVEEARGVAPVVELLASGFGALVLAYGGRHRQGYEVAVASARRAEELGWPTGRGAMAYCEAECLIAFDRPAALRAHRRADELASRTDGRFFRAVNLVSWATAEGRYGDPDDAFRRFAEALDYFVPLGSWSYLSTLVRNLSELLVRVERYDDSFLLRTAVTHLEGSSGVSGVDIGRDAYLAALLDDRLVDEHRHELVGRAAELDREAVLELARRVVAAELARSRSAGGVRAVVFTDLEGATSFMAERGDRGSRDVLRRYEELTLDLLARHGGQRVKGTGDGMLLLFPSVSAALRCLAELQQELAARPDEHPLRVRAGVHAGELIDETASEDGDDVHGTVVNLTARLVDRADGGEVVLSDTARQIVAGADLVFTPLGPAQLKGIPDPVLLHRYEWQDGPRGRS